MQNFLRNLLEKVIVNFYTHFIPKIHINFAWKLRKTVCSLVIQSTQNHYLIFVFNSITQWMSPMCLCTQRIEDFKHWFCRIQNSICLKKIGFFNSSLPVGGLEAVINVKWMKTVNCQGHVLVIQIYIRKPVYTYYTGV